MKLPTTHGKKSQELFLARMERSSAILVSHEMGQMRNFCDAGIVLHQGKLSFFEDINAGIEAHLENIRRSAKR